MRLLMNAATKYVVLYCSNIFIFFSAKMLKK